MEEVLKQLITEFYRGFAGFEVEYTKDFYLALRKIEKLDLAEYEKTHLEEDLDFQIHKAVLSERHIIGLTGVTDYDTLVKVAVFTMKLGGETFKRIVEKMLRENSAIQAEDTIMEKNEIIQENVDRLTECKELKRIAEERIRTLENDLKIERELIKSLENDAIKLNEEMKMFDAKMNTSAIKKRYEWQAFKKLNEEEIKQ
ncbi:hypothetical protein RhiirA1_476708 [Rhizophagus irregularis]|uniref:Uncharacterized protein n=1 Tax=Rhizophagus irregularis TaxID=588596 RepID=A0A2N0QUM2_9GLOM|nr:hypothetical protein RhiirA1_476708 [Rhizophagus irregularis]